MSDSNTTLKELKHLVAEFMHARKWEPFHSPKNLSMSIAIESAELMEHFQWLSPAESSQSLRNPDNKDAITDELADILIYCLTFANQADIDISAAIRQKMLRNETRFPVSI